MGLTYLMGLSNIAITICKEALIVPSLTTSSSWLLIAFDMTLTVFDNSLLLGTSNCSKLIMFVSSPRLGISYLSKNPQLLLVGNDISRQPCGYWAVMFLGILMGSVGKIYLVLSEQDSYIFISRSYEFLIPHEFTLSPVQIQDVLSNFYTTYASPHFYFNSTWRMTVLEYLTLHTSQDQNNSYKYYPHYHNSEKLYFSPAYALIFS